MPRNPDDQDVRDEPMAEDTDVIDSADEEDEDEAFEDEDDDTDEEDELIGR